MTDGRFPPLPEDHTISSPSGEADHAPAAEESSSPAAGPSAAEPPGAPISPVAGHPLEVAQRSFAGLQLPDDLQISWSWVHLLFFLLSAAASFVVLPLVLAIAVQSYSGRPQMHVQQLASNAVFLVIAQVFCFGAVMFFLYMTLAVLRDAPFWTTLGWKKLEVQTRKRNYKAWMFPLLGCGLAIFVALGSSRVKDAENAPIEQLFKDPHAAFLLMAMAVLIAPLVEETVFRGYLYPLFAGNFAKLAAHCGADSSRAVRFGTVSGVLLTGFLFGMLHGYQLGWNLTLVSLLTLVGVIFTFARAATGTVLASFLMHLGYNSLIAVITILATKGFTVAPPGH
jgi:membrane protease YdiL (CAAX protease family)